MSLAIENIQVRNWVTPDNLKDQLENGAKYEFLGGIHHLNSKKWLYDPKAIGYASTFFIKLPQITHWYTALQRLNLLPEHVPALPENFFEIYFSNCPIKEMEGKLKEDNTPYKVYETHSLYLIPTMSLNDLESRVSAYGRDVLGAQNDQENPLRLRFMADFRDVLGDVLSPQWEWVLIPNEVLKELRYKTFSNQLKTLKTFNQRVADGSNYEVGTFKQVATFLFFHKIATGEIAYENPNAQRGYYDNYVRVQENLNKGCRFLIGSYGRFGVGVKLFCDWSCNGIGIAVLRKLS